MIVVPAETTGCRGAFGYLPGLQDLVRVRAVGREVRSFEDWLDKGLAQARWHLGGGFVSAYPQLCHRFVFRPDNSDQVVLGVVYASQDSHRRPFPFVAFELLPREIWDTNALQIVFRCNDLFAEFEGLIRDIGALSHVGQVHGRLLALRAPLVSDAPGALEPIVDPREAARYGNFLSEVSCDELGHPTTAPGVNLCNQLINILSRHHAEPRQLRQVLAIPLTRPVFARDLELRFYLSFCLALLNQATPTLSLFWRMGDPAPAHGSLFVAFREPAIDLFEALLRPDRSSPSILSVGRQDDAAIAAPPGLMSIAADTTLAGLLAALPGTATLRNLI